MLVFSLALYSCEKDDFVPEENYGQDTTAKIKTKYIFASSTDSVPYNYVSYCYDEYWNLIKELISSYPEPGFASYTYKYSDKGLLLNKKYYAMEGMNFPDQTESDFTLITESIYSYSKNIKTEIKYLKNTLRDSAIYTYSNNLLISEYHYYLQDNWVWSRIYEYDTDNNLIKFTDNPDGICTVNTYDGTRILKSTEYDQNGSVLIEITYTYTESDGNLIVESYYDGFNGEFLSDKTTYKDGNIIEYIKYHPTMPGEWYCYRYEYY